MNDYWRRTVCLRTKTVRCGEIEKIYLRRTEERDSDMDRVTKTYSEEISSRCVMELGGTEMRKTSR